MKVINLLEQHMKEASESWAESTDKLTFGYRIGKYFRWILPTYKGRGRPRNDDYEKA